MIGAARRFLSASERYLRQAGRAKRFHRGRAMVAIYKPVRGFWQDNLDGLFAFLDEGNRWAGIQRFAQAASPSTVYLWRSGEIRKELTVEEREYLQRLLADWDNYGNVMELAAVIAAGGRQEVYQAAGTFALGQLGIKADFELKNERILDALRARSQADIFATRGNIERVFDTIVRNFYDLGSNPFDRAFLDELKSDLGYKTDYEAKRFALTETGIAAESAQMETWRRNGVTRKQWRILGVNTRPTHQALDKVTVGIEEKFLVGGFEADHPLDPTLPPEELINCHCWSKPVVDVNFQIDPAGVWSGA